MNELFGVNEFFDGEGLTQLISRLGINLAFTAVVIVGVYFRKYRNRDYVFTYFLFNVITFCMCFLLRQVPIDLGFALGLFAVFGILRYRTEPIGIRDLTYLFVVIGFGILNSVLDATVSAVELLAVNTIIAGMVGLLEMRPTNQACYSRPVFYDNLELLKPGKHDALIADLRNRTGLDVRRVDVHRIDMIRDAAEVTIHSALSRNAPTSAPQSSSTSAAKVDGARIHV